MIDKMTDIKTNINRLESELEWDCTPNTYIECKCGKESQEYDEDFEDTELGDMEYYNEIIIENYEDYRELVEEQGNLYGRNSWF